MTFGRVGIVGLGLMGGSLARALAARNVEVLALDELESSVDAALSEGIVSGRLALESLDLAPLDLLVLATPVDAAVGLLRKVAPILRERTLVTDLGSTKRSVCREAVSLGIADRFIGSHPLAGDHRSGWDAARSDLFVGATVFVTPAGDAPPAHVERLEELWASLGALPVRMDAEEHDRRMAWISHLPQTLASALAATLAHGGISPDELGPGGRDMTRLAASSAEMWTAIAMDNAAELESAVQEVQNRLSSFEQALRGGDRDAILRFFREANGWVR